MKICAFNPVSYNKCVKENKSLSFCGRSPQKIIEDLLNNQQGQSHSIKEKELFSIYQYFGYINDRTRGSHNQLIGPYGQTVTVVSASNDYQESTKRIKDALSRLDLFDNELIIFDQQPTEEEIKNWQNIIKTKTPNPECENKYAQKAQKNKQETEISKEDLRLKNQKLFEKISAQRLSMVETAQLTEEYIEKFNSVKDNFTDAKHGLEQRNYKDEEKIIEKAEKQKKEIEDLIAKVQRLISVYNLMFQNGEALSDSELQKLYSSEVEIESKIESISQATFKMETIYLEMLENEEALIKECREYYKKALEIHAKHSAQIKEFQKPTKSGVYLGLEGVAFAKFESQIQTLANEIKSNNYNHSETDITFEEYLKEQLENVKHLYAPITTTSKEFEKIISLKQEISRAYDELIQTFSEHIANVEKYQEIFDKNLCAVFKKDVIEKCSKGLEEAQKALIEIEKKINPNLKNTASSFEEYEKQLTKIKNRINMVKLAKEKFENTSKIIDAEFVFSEEEIEQYRKERQEKINKRFSQHKAEENPAEEQTQTIIEKSEIPEIEDVFEKEEFDINKFSATREQIAQRLEEFHAQIGNRKSLDELYRKIWGNKNKNIVEFSKVLAKQIAPLDFNETIYLLSYLISVNAKETDIESYKNSPDASLIYINNIANKVMKSPEGQRIKNATRFAFLDSVYNKSTDKNADIYTIDSKATKDLFYKIKRGYTKINVSSKGKDVTVSFDERMNIGNINYLIKAYTMQMKYSAKIDNVLDKLLEYSPVKSEDLKAKAKEFLKQQGMYYESLADESCVNELKKILIESFWSDFDKISQTNIAQKTVENYLEKQKEAENKQRQQKKIDMFETIDWDF